MSSQTNNANIQQKEQNICSVAAPYVNKLPKAIKRTLRTSRKTGDIIGRILKPNSAEPTHKRIQTLSTTSKLAFSLLISISKCFELIWLRTTDKGMVRY